MSFSSEAKKEIAHTLPGKACCELAEAAGFFRAAGSLKPAGGGEIGLVLSTGIPAVARHMKRLFEKLSGAPLFVSVADTGGRVSPRRFELNLPASQAGADLLIRAGILSKKNGLLAAEKGIAPVLTSAKCCRKSYLKGLFLGAGSVADPAKRYHFEIVIGDPALAADIRRLMNGFTDIHANITRRGGKDVVYLKAAEQIKDMLGILDAHLHLLAYEDARARHEIRGRANRFSNCDNANLDRQAEAVYGHLRAIGAIEAEPGGLGALTAKLREIAEARKANPEASLAELAALLDPPVTKSAAAARLRRIEKTADVHNAPAHKE
ncbi:MAG: DNA-binding protein WhiA [Clostridiales Family XIII bacterium]|jgi:DNA-binding protein WhiA|nr:DNA-binding protein WhiA [Clostridiales Family XIII bacterium]